MKKKLALLLALVMVIGTLAGCSTAELGYLDLAMESALVTSGEISGEVSIHMDMAVLGAELKKLEDDSQLGDLSESVEEAFSDLKLDMSVTYTGVFRTAGATAMDLTLTAAMNGKNYDLGRLILAEDGTAAVSRQAVFGLMEIAEAADPDRENCYAYSSDYKAELQKKLAGSEYIGFPRQLETAGLFLEDAIEAGASQQAVSGKLLNATELFLTDAHKNYSTNLFRKLGGSYELNAKLSDLPQLLDSYLTYVDQNRETYYKAFIRFGLSLNQLTSQTAGAEEPKTSESSGVIGGEEEPFLTMEDWNEIIDGATMARRYLNQIKNHKLFQAFGDSYLKSAISRSGGGFANEFSMGISIGGKTPISMEGKSRCTQKDVKVQMPELQMTAEQLSGILNELSEKYNRVDYGVIQWEEDEAYRWLGDETWMSVYTEKTEPLWGKFNQVDFVGIEDKDGTLFVRLSDVCDALGEKLYWNSNVEKAYVEKNGKSIYLDGYQKEQATWIKVRELEKLGYTVTYEKDELGMNQVTLKQK